MKRYILSLILLITASPMWAQFFSLYNPEDVAAAEPWLVVCNLWNDAGLTSYNSTLATRDGNLSFDFLSDAGGGVWELTTNNSAAPGTETFYFQQWLDGDFTSVFLAGDVVTIKGKAAFNGQEGTKAYAILKFLDFGFQPTIDAVQLEITAGTLTDFEVSTTFTGTAPTGTKGVQIGFAIQSFGDVAGTLQFSDLKAFIGEEQTGGETWAGFPVSDGWVDTGSFLGWVNVSFGDWIYVLNLENWVFMPEATAAASETSGGAWGYINR